MTEALKPCPFCGGEAVANNYILEGAVRCQRCGATVGAGTWDKPLPSVTVRTPRTALWPKPVLRDTKRSSDETR